MLPYLIPLTLMACGCGAEDRIPVSGKVTKRGGQITSGEITFHPDVDRGTPGHHQPRAIIESNGEYTLYTDHEIGAPAGWYKVTISAQQAAPGDATSARAYAPPKYLVAPPYLDPEKTPISIEVKRDAPAGSYHIQVSD